MKFDEIFTPFHLTQRKKDWITFLTSQKGWSQKSDGSWDVNGDVDLGSLDLTEIPIPFYRITGYFICCHNRLTSLKGCPKFIGGEFNCNANRLINLVGGPEKVGGDYWCVGNQLKSLEGAAKYVGKMFFCSRNQLVSLEHAPDFVGKQLYCGHNVKPAIELKTTVERDYLRRD